MGLFRVSNSCLWVWIWVYGFIHSTVPFWTIACILFLLIPVHQVPPLPLIFCFPVFTVLGVAEFAVCAESVITDWL